MVLHKHLSEIEQLYCAMERKDITSARRASYGYSIIRIIREYPQVEKYWEYKPNEFFWVNRFAKRDTTPPPIEFANKPVYRDEDTNLRDMPDYCGLYFLGDVRANPHTGEMFYSVKIGLSSNIKKRMNSYRTSNPMAYKIDCKPCEDYEIQEQWYQSLLSQIALYRNQNNDEWWFVDRDTYLEMCEKKFDYFSL